MRAKEPLAKVVSSDLRPRSGMFSIWNFGEWNHHAPHSRPKTHSKWDCNSSTQTFASGSKESGFTLIEALVALMIASTALVVLMGRLGVSADTQRSLSMHELELEHAYNKLAELTLT